MRKVVAIKFDQPYFLSNLFVLNRILGVPLSIAKPICKKEDNGEWIDVNLPIKSELTTDEILEHLAAYEVEIKLEYS